MGSIYTDVEELGIRFYLSPLTIQRESLLQGV